MSIAVYLFIGAIVSATITVVVLWWARREARDDRARVTRITALVDRDRDPSLDRPWRRPDPPVPSALSDQMRRQVRADLDEVQRRAQQQRLRTTAETRERVRDFGLTDHTFWSTTILEAPIPPTPVDCTPSSSSSSGGSDSSSSGGCDSGGSGSGSSD